MILEIFLRYGVVAYMVPYLRVNWRNPPKGFNRMASTVLNLPACKQLL